MQRKADSIMWIFIPTRLSWEQRIGMVQVLLRADCPQAGPMNIRAALQNNCVPAGEPCQQRCQMLASLLSVWFGPLYFSVPTCRTVQYWPSQPVTLKDVGLQLQPQGTYPRCVHTTHAAHGTLCSVRDLRGNKQLGG